MAIDADEEILQDFLIEASEILETLSEQLIELENNPQDMNLLNAIFRGFHTVKGGAGFLNLTAMVEVCHITENIFDILRNGSRTADPELMDAVLQALDNVNHMFSEVKAGEQPTPAPHSLLETLETFAAPDDGASADPDDIDPMQEFESAVLTAEQEAGQDVESLIEKTAPTSKSTQSSNQDISDDEFENLLDEIHGQGKFKTSEEEPKTKSQKAAPADKKATPAKSSSGVQDISDDEFEALLDELHGKGGKVAAKKAETTTSAKPAAAKPPSAKPAAKSSSSQEGISDDEFEALLDQLHGSGKAPTAVGGNASSSGTTPPATAKPAPKAAAPAPKAAAPAPKAAAPAPKAAAPVAKPSPAKSADAGVKPPAQSSNAIVSESTVRVDTARLDDIMNMVGELVLARNRLKMLGQNYQDEALAKAVATLDVVTSDLQGSVMKTRMQPIKKVFGRFPRVVRDLARNLKKEVSLQLIGEDTDLDKNLVEALADPLVHLVRNSVDHGVETPEVRVAAGKPRTGKIILSAAQEGDHIQLAIEDDGKGMDPDMLRQKVVEKGLMDADQADRLDDTECFNLIFMAGFSTKEQISDVSGRGVGMDVVKTKITQLNGSLNIDSRLGQGTKIQIKVPLTLAILPTLMVTVGEQVFALPLASVSEIFHLDLTRTNVVDGQETVIVRDKALPLFYLDNWLLPIGKRKGKKLKEGHVVIVQVGTHKVGFVVESLIGQEEVVIKPLGRSLQGTPGMAGATITSDGGIALILDVPSLLKTYAKRS